MMAELYRRAEVRLRERRKDRKVMARNPKLAADPQRLLHELQVHQVELEMQNAELLESRDRTEAMLEKYTDLYDFAPVGYFSLDGDGKILEVNLTGAALLGVGRSKLLNRQLLQFVVPASRRQFQAFLDQIFGGSGKHVCEATMVKENVASFWASFHGASAISRSGPKRWCRVVVSDITALKRAEEAQRRMEALAKANQEMKAEIARRRVVEASLKQSEQHQTILLERSWQMQEQLRQLSRQVLMAQEDERKRISRELHDVIAQTLTGINVRLATLKKEAALNTKGLDGNIAKTQELVEHSVEIVHQFARELRPAVLDDLGLIPALRTFMETFTAETGVRAEVTAFAGVEQLNTSGRTVLFRIAQEALANVAKHARASRVKVDIEKLTAGIRMKVHDNGKSFNAEASMAANRGKRLGLLGMRERLEMIGGSFAIESAPGSGTTVIANIPLLQLKPGREKLPFGVGTVKH
jgi:PAS domain S-box-containing protein